MKKKNKNTILVLNILFLLIIGMSGCVDLDETIYSSISPDNYYNDRTEVVAAVTRHYTHARSWHSGISHHSSHHWLQELSGDWLAWPQKGRHGYDQGAWIQLHHHSWTDLHGQISNTWSGIYRGIGYINNVLGDFETIDFAAINITDAEIDIWVAELKVNRAWHYLCLMNIFGNIPISTTVAEPLSPPTEPRTKVFEFIEQELLENIDKLPNKSPATIGRINKAAGYALLADLYLNAEIYTGQARWDDAIAAADRILTGQTGDLELDTDIMVTFGPSNDVDSREILFDIAYDRQVGGQSMSISAYWHYQDRFALNTGVGGWNGVVIIPDAFDAYQDNDLRKQQWVRIGPVTDYFTGEPLMGTEEYAGQPLVYVREIHRASEGQPADEGTMIHGEENSGARIGKWMQGTPDHPRYRSNNWVVYRLTEIYYIKAEALIRKNNGVATQEAVDLINTARERNFDPADWPTEMYTTASLTLDELCWERGREFMGEGKRRTDLIRFERFNTGTWWDKGVTQPHTQLFPVPDAALQANPNLVQNPGY